MGCIKRERQVLKLVHPGRHVEIHNEPITAAEVMRRNPRHCIARPDVFEFPSIVVKPESILLPGNVFFIVPNHTLYNLLKTKGQRNHSRLAQNQSSNNGLVSSCTWLRSKFHTYKQHIRCFFTREGRVVGESRKVKEKLHAFNKVFLPLFFHSPFPQRGSNCQSNTNSPNVESLCKYEGDDGSNQNQSQVEDTPYDDVIENQKNNEDIQMELHNKGILRHNEHVTVLKSCLRRPDSIRKSLNLKVSFDIPNKKQEQQVALNMFRSKFFAYLGW